MGLLDDAASVISGRTSHHGAHRTKHKKHRSRSRSRSRGERSSRPSLTAQFFGLGGSEKRHHRRQSGSASIFGGESYSKHNGSRSSFFSLPGGNASRGSVFGFGE